MKNFASFHDAGARVLVLASILVTAFASAHGSTPLARKVSFLAGTIESGLLHSERGLPGGVGYELVASRDGAPGTVSSLIRYDNNGIETGNAELLTDAASHLASLIGVADVPGRFFADYVHDSGYADVGLFNFSDLSAVFSKRLTLTAPATETTFVGFPNNTLGVLQNGGTSIKLTLFNSTNGNLVFEQTYTSDAFVATSGPLDSQLVNLILLPDHSGYVLLVSSNQIDLGGGGLTYHSSFVIAYLNTSGAVLATTRLQLTSDGVLFVPPQCQRVLSDNSILVNILQQNFDPGQGVPPVNHLFNIRSNGTLKWSKLYSGAVLNGERENTANGNVYFSGYRFTSTDQPPEADVVFARISVADGSLLNQANVAVGAGFPLAAIIGFNGSAVFADALTPGGGIGTYRKTLLKLGLDLSAVTAAVKYERDVNFGVLGHDAANAELLLSTSENSTDVAAITLTENLVPTATLGCTLFTSVAIPVTSPGITVAVEPLVPVAVTVNAVSSVPVTTAASFSLSHTLSASSDICTVVAAAPVISSALTASGTVGSAFSYTIAASNNPTSYNATGLPAGLSVNTGTGAITGTPTAAAVTNVTIFATNGTGTGQATLEITINPPAPVINSALTATGTVGSAFSYTITASNSPTSYDATGLPAGLSVNTGTGAITGTPTTAAVTNVTISATNGTGTGQATLQITVNPPAPVINSVLTASGTVGSAFSYTITASNSPTSYNATGLPAGLSVNTGTGAITGTPTTAAVTNVTISATNGTGTGQATLQVTINSATPTAPSIATQPANQTVTAPALATFTVTATGTPSTFTYTWQRKPAGSGTFDTLSNGGGYSGVSTATLTVDPTSTGMSGDQFRCLVGNTVAPDATSNAATLTVNVSTSRLINLSVRTGAGTGSQTLIVGFVVGGAGTNQVLVRGIGPTLGAFGVPGVLADPQLRIFSGNTLLQENDDWGGGGALTAAFTSVFAFALPPTSKDAAMLATLGSASYTTHCSSTAGTGIALVELYDLLAPGSTARLINVSARTQVGTGDGILIAGFVIDGVTSKTLLIRGIGPTLGDFGVGGVLADPQLALFSGNTVVQSNDNWGGTAPLTAAFGTVFAFALPAASKDAAMLVTLAPGTYTAQVSGVGATTGVALVELYELP